MNCCSARFNKCHNAFSKWSKIICIDNALYECALCVVKSQVPGNMRTLVSELPNYCQVKRDKKTFHGEPILHTQSLYANKIGVITSRDADRNEPLVMQFTSGFRCIWRFQDCSACLLRSSAGMASLGHAWFLDRWNASCCMWADSHHSLTPQIKWLQKKIYNERSTIHCYYTFLYT